MLVPAKLFTPHEANRTLPYVRRVVDDLLNHGRELRVLWEREEPLSVDEAERAVEVAEQLEELHRELDLIGCSFRSVNFEVGVIEFPAMLQGELVHLSWRHDEADLRHYHGPRESHDQRRPIPADLLEASS